MIKQNVSKLQIILMSLSFKTKKKGKKARKEKKRWFTAGKKTTKQTNKQKTENCDTRTYDVIRLNF